MDLQTALSATQSPDFRDLLFPSPRDLNPGGLSGDERFGEYLERALGNESNASANSTKYSEASEARYTGDSAARSNTSSGEGADQTGEKKSSSPEAAARNSDKTEDKNPKAAEEAPGDAKNKSGKTSEAEKVLTSEESKKTAREGIKNRETPEESGHPAGGNVGNAGKKETGEEPVHSRGKGEASSPEAASPRKVEGKSPDAAAAAARGGADPVRTGGDPQESGQQAGAETVRKSPMADTKQPSGGDAGNKNTGDHREPSFRVVDLRKGRGGNGAGNRAERSEGGTRESSGAGKEAFNSSSVDRALLGEERGTDSVRLVRPEGDASLGRELTDKSQPRSGLSQEQQTLFKSMRDSGNGEIVKRAGIILKDNSSGEIRMDLKPEKLGKVRVQIHLKDNTLSGKIVVESSAVREVFESNMEALHRAFKESGFESAELDVQVGGGRQQEHQGSHKQRPRTAENIRTLEEHVSLSREGGYFEGVIDLVV